MRQAAALYQQVSAWNPHVASYMIPNGFNRRVLFSLNLRQAFHFCRLRAAENAHFSIRRVAHQLAEAIQQVYPLFGAYLELPEGITLASIENEYFSSLNAN
jgi:thymidylate synthase ThyX